jgi:hypothetical protein
MGQGEGLTNAGKKEQRQYRQILNKAVKEGRLEAGGQTREIESRPVPKQHSPRKGGRGR